MRSRPGFGLDIYRGISRAGGGSNGGNRDIFSQLDGVFHLHSQKHLVLDNVANHLAGLAVGLQDLLQACRRALRGFQRAQRELNLFGLGVKQMRQAQFLHADGRKDNIDRVVSVDVDIGVQVRNIRHRHNAYLPCDLIWFV